MNENSEALIAPPAKRFQVTAEQKVQWVRRFIESGLSIRKFSAQNGLPQMSLCRWVNRARGNQSTDRAVEAQPAAPAFTEIKLVPSVERSDWVAELSLSNGKVLRLSKEVPAAMLEQLLRLC